MSDDYPLEPAEDIQGEAIYREVLAGRNLHIIARRFGVSLQAVEAAYVRHLPKLDVRSLGRMQQHQVALMQDLQVTFKERAEQQGDTQAAAIVVKCCERISELTGLDAPRQTAVDVRLNQPTMSNADMLEVVRGIKTESDQRKAKLRAQIEALGPPPDTEPQPQPQPPPYDGNDPLN